jgi:hypothetical protein
MEKNATKNMAYIKKENYIMNRKLFKNIKKFYKTYCLEDNKIEFTKDDMYNHNALMSTYEAIWFSLEEYDDSMTCKFLINLYGEVCDYISSTIYRTATPYKWQSQTMGNIVCTFSEVIHQAWDSLIHYHMLDLKWSYDKRGF